MLDIKTLIELFDRCQLENIIAGISLAPEKIIFVGFKENMKPGKRIAIKRFFKMRGINVTIEYEIVPRYNFDEIVQRLDFIVKRNPDCCFDLTGGGELVIAAMGYVAAQRSLPVLQFNIFAGKLIPVKSFTSPPGAKRPSLGIKESIVLNGGTIVNKDKSDYKWQMTDDFKRDIQNMWDICRENCGLWNRQCDILSKLSGCGKSDGCLVTVDTRQLPEQKKDIMPDEGLVKKLLSFGLLTEFRLDKSSVSFRFKNDRVMRVICKAGNILELYVYMTAGEISVSEGGVYDDIDISVIVDWDGPDECSPTGICTRNEIDIMLMRGVVPIFISCKNGGVHKEALYELDSIANRFGGEYAGKVLITTYISRDTLKRKHLLKRAEEMGIRVIDRVDKMSREEFVSVLKTIR